MNHRDALVARIVTALKADRSGRGWQTFFRFDSTERRMIWTPEGLALGWTEWSAVFNSMGGGRWEAAWNRRRAA